MNQVVFQIPPNGSRKAKKKKKKRNQTQNDTRVRTAIMGDIHQGPGTPWASSVSVLHSVFYRQRHLLVRYLPWTPRQRRQHQRDHLFLSCGLVFHRWRRGGGSAIPLLLGMVLKNAGGGWGGCGGSKGPPPPRAGLAHLVVVGDGGFAQLPFKVQLEGEIQVPLRGGEEEKREEEKRREGFQRRAEARSSGPAADLRPELFLLI